MAARIQKPDPPVKSLGKRILYAGAVLCLFAFIFGSLCMTIVAVIGAGENPPKIFEQMGGASCGLFALGTIICLIGWLVSVTAEPDKPQPIKPKAQPPADPSSDPQDATLQSEPEPESEPQTPSGDKPDPYASHHRRREF